MRLRTFLTMPPALDPQWTTAIACALLVCCHAVACLPHALAYVNPSAGQPVPHRVLRGFEEPEHKWSPGHRGVDLDAAVGSEVRSAAAGTVAFAGVVAGKPVVSIDHADGIRTTYQPVHARVRQGDAVTEGQVIGTLGHPVDGFPGLHWGALTGKDTYIDPLTLLDAPVIRLKPL